MYLRDVTNGGAIPAMEKMLAYTQARHRMLAENVANVDTPGYETRQLDAADFQRSLRAAIDRKKAGGEEELILEPTGEFAQDADGRLRVTPSTEPPENVLFQDQTNVRIERQMAMMAENALMHQTMTELLRTRFDGLLKAIRGRVS